MSGKVSPMTQGPVPSRDVHAIEVRPGLVLVFHHSGVPVEAALAAVRGRVGPGYELLPIRTDPATIPAIDDAMERHDSQDQDDGPSFPLTGTGEPN